MPQVQGANLGEGAGEGRVVEERDRGGKKKYTKHPTTLSHDFIKNWVFSKSSQNLLPWGGEKKKKSTFSLFSWLEAGANPADIYTRAQPCMRTG